MTETVKALNRFFSRFGLPAYEENAVPATVENAQTGAREDVRPPYITVQLISPEPGQKTPFFARIWYRDLSNVVINAKADEIGAAIGSGVSVRTGSGCIKIYKDNPFAQHMPMAGDTTLKCVYLRMQLLALTN